ncbi:hypothetical protein P692DRAFT_20822238, partial [Suillus brevipes Sb2]
ITSCRVNDIRNMETQSAENVFALISHPADGSEYFVTILSASDTDFTVQCKITPDWVIEIDHNDDTMRLRWTIPSHSPGMVWEVTFDDSHVCRDFAERVVSYREYARIQLEAGLWDAFTTDFNCDDEVRNPDEDEGQYILV